MSQKHLKQELKDEVEGYKNLAKHWEAMAKTNTERHVRRINELTAELNEADMLIQQVASEVRFLANYFGTHSEKQGLINRILSLLDNHIRRSGVGHDLTDIPF